MVLTSIHFQGLHVGRDDQAADLAESDRLGRLAHPAHPPSLSLGVHGVHLLRPRLPLDQLDQERGRLGVEVLGDDVRHVGLHVCLGPRVPLGLDRQVVLLRDSRHGVDRMPRLCLRQTDQAPGMLRAGQVRVPLARAEANARPVAHLARLWPGVPTVATGQKLDKVLIPRGFGGNVVLAPAVLVSVSVLILALIPALILATAAVVPLHPRARV